MQDDIHHDCKTCKTKTLQDVTPLTNHFRLLCKICNNQLLIPYGEMPPIKKEKVVVRKIKYFF
jgi:hypothetical protein